MSRESVSLFQLFEPQSSTYTYLLGDLRSGEALFIDPVLETVERDLTLLHELGWQLKYILDTHVHADHITGAASLRERTGAQTGISAAAQVTCADLDLIDGQVLPFGAEGVKVIATPGHTASCLSYLVGPYLFTGDALLIRGTGRTDFQQGSASLLYRSVHEKLFVLPDETIVYPAHDYKGQTRSTIGLEKKFNPRLGGDRSQSDFVAIMDNLKLAQPQKIAVALPANLACGKPVKTDAGAH